MTTIKLTLTASAILVLFATATVWVLIPVAQSHTAMPLTSPIVSRAPAPRQPEERSAGIAQCAVSKNNLLQIGVAMHDYHSAYDHLPQNITSKDGIPLLSWRVALLPYIKEVALYKQFSLDEPWDSDNNKKLLGKMPKLYRSGIEAKDATKTYYQVFAGKGTAFEPNKELRLTDIQDGTAVTFGVVETGPAVEWTKPEDLAYDPKKPLPKLELPFKNVFNVGMMDASPWSFRPNVDPADLRFLINVDDGVPGPDFDKLQAELPLTTQDLEAAIEFFRANEKVIEAITKQLRDQEQLLMGLGKKPNPAKSVQGLEVDRLMETLSDLLRMRVRLEGANEVLKRENEELRKQLKAAEKKK